jgi:hypothetical protein
MFLFYKKKISWSACPDDKTSADTFSGGVAVGAMSNVSFNNNLFSKKKTAHFVFFNRLSSRYSVGLEDFAFILSTDWLLPKKLIDQNKHIMNFFDLSG